MMHALKNSMDYVPGHFAQHTSTISAVATRRHVWVLLGLTTVVLLWRIIVASASAKDYPSSSMVYDILNDTLGFQQIFLLSNSTPTRTAYTDTALLAASYTNLTLTIVPLDPSISHRRNHMDLLRHIVTENIATALILSDDADWDIRIKKQMWWFGVASRTLIMPLAADKLGRRARIGEDGEYVYADKTFPVPVKAGEERRARLDAMIFNGVETYSDLEIDIRKAPVTLTPSKSPYGDGWGILWLGHGGDSFIEPITTNPLSPRGRVILPADQTVPERDSLRWGEGSDEIAVRYPHHTRVVSHSGKALGTTAYAVTQTSARQILFELNLPEQRALDPKTTANTSPVSDLHLDTLLRSYCRTHEQRNCLGVQPALFAPFDMDKEANWDPNFLQRLDGERQKEFKRMRGQSGNVRWSVRLGLARLVEGLGVFDQWPDRKMLVKGEM